MLKDFISLIFPETCSVCNNVLRKNEGVICTKCYLELPKTDYHVDKNNYLNQKFYGKVDVKYASSYLKFVKSGSVQKLMHQLKYQDREDIGLLLGKWYGLTLKRDLEITFDKIIPVPMHKNKLKRRGYNQADSIAKGLSSSLNIEWNNNILLKITDTDSQTKKNRFNRWLNTNEVFAMNHNLNIEGLDILLIDDVVTTGSTLEACAKVLLEEGECRSVSIVTIAIAT